MFHSLVCYVGLSVAHLGLACFELAWLDRCKGRSRWAARRGSWVATRRASSRKTTATTSSAVRGALHRHFEITREPPNSFRVNADLVEPFYVGIISGASFDSVQYALHVTAWTSQVPKIMGVVAESRRVQWAIIMDTAGFRQKCLQCGWTVSWGCRLFHDAVLPGDD